MKAASGPSHEDWVALRADKHWSVEEAVAAHNKAEVENPGLPLWASPLGQWTALHQLDALEQQFLSGNHVALMRAIDLCGRHDLVMPRWVVSAFSRRFRSVLNLRAGSWDEAFGRPHPKGKHLVRARDRETKRSEVWRRIRDIRSREPHTPIGDGLFERVGAELGVSKTVCNELYYQNERRLGRLLPK